MERKTKKELKDIQKDVMNIPEYTMESKGNPENYIININKNLRDRLLKFSVIRTRLRTKHRSLT